MPDPAPVTLVPLGTVDLAELEAVAKRVSRILGLGVEVGKPLPLPAGHFDAARSQSSARKVVTAVPPVVVPPPRPAPGAAPAAVTTSAASLPPIESWGSRVHGPATPSGTGAPKPAPPPIRVGVTDTDLYSDKRDFDFVFAEPASRRAVVSSRRLKEAFWKRKSDPPRQQTRLVREIVGAVALAAGAAPCENPDCAASSAKSPL